MSIFPGRVLLTSIVATLLVLATLAGGERRAGAQITGLVVDNSASSGSVSNGAGQNLCFTSPGGTVAPLGGNAGESRNLVNITGQTATSFTTRFVADLCTDSGGSTVTVVVSFSCDPGTNSESLSTDYTTHFGVQAPAGTPYRLTVSNTIAGEADINNDGGGAAVANVSQISTSETGGVLFAGTDLNLTSGLPVSNLQSGSAAFGQTKSVQYVGTGSYNGDNLVCTASGTPNACCTGVQTGTCGSQAHSIHSTWNANCFSPSSGQECGIRMGLTCSIGGAALAGDTTFGPGGIYPGSPDRTQTTDGQFVTVGLEFCGDGAVQQDGVISEACDQGLDPVTGNGGTNSCCASDCTVKSNGTACRPAADAGQCDVAEVCNGVSPACPADAKKSAGTACTDDGNPCSSDKCDGVSSACQHPPGNSGALCHASISADCDPPEFCTGVSTTCPANVHRPDGFLCSPDGNPCTLDVCDNASGLCIHPAGNATVQCRAATDVCDAAEFCDGSSTACPPDVKKSAGTPCPDDGKLCTKDQCNGSSNACQHTPAFAGTICRPALDSNCDYEEVCDGSTPDCPVDKIAPAGISCRTIAAPCDLEEFCTGISGACPPDEFRPNTDVCRPQVGAADGLCDVAEYCTGTGADCPVDAVAVAGTECRASVGVCDVAEVCDGTLKTCPADQLAPMTVVCRDVLPPPEGETSCDLPEYCTGTYAGCPFDQKLDGSNVCRQAISICDVDDYCDGINSACPPDQSGPPNVICRVDVDFCDLPEACTGTSPACPPDSFKAPTLCRDVNGICDVAEFCTGASASCPPDSFKSTATLCRAAGISASPDCDVDEFCPGNDAACPPDAHKPDGTLCSLVGGNPNICLNACVTGACTNACPASGDINTPGCPIPGSVVVPLCCGNGIIEGGEQCDDGNQLSGDACPSLPSDDCQLNSAGTLIRGNIRNPATDTKGCQIEYSVLNPNAVPDRFGQPSNIQVCQDQDPTCDLDPRPGRCRFHVVACVNNNDPNLPLCTPAGLNSVVINTRPYLRKSSPQMTLVGVNVAKFTTALTQLFDPMNPGNGFSNTPPLDPTQADMCSGGMLIDVFASSAGPNQSMAASQRLSVNSKNQKIPTPQRNTSSLFLECQALPLPH